jgi:hypothetical protein
MNRTKRSTRNTATPRSTAKRANTKQPANTGSAPKSRAKSGTTSGAKSGAKSMANSGANSTATSADPRTVTDIRISSSGTRWSVKLSNGLRVSVPAAAAHACNVRVGTRWSDALLLRVERSAARQRLVTRAMGLLAKGRCTSRVELRQALGGGRDATATVAELAKLGWIS